MKKKYDLFAFGNALVDYVFINITSDFLKKNNLTSGDMHLINAEKAIEIDSLLLNNKKIKIAGGSATNVACGFANLGGTAAVSGSIGNDDNGIFFENNLIDSKVTPIISKSKNHETGVARTFITKNKNNMVERTFATNLGAAPDYKLKNFPEKDLLQSSLFHTTGYTFQAMRNVFMRAFDIAKNNNIPISLDLSSPSVISAFKQDLISIVKKYVSYIFMNEDESRAFTGCDDPLVAIEFFKNDCETVIIKLGAGGSVIHNNNKNIHIPPFKVDQVLDVNGAGDGYTAGFLYGLSQGYNLATAGKLGSLYGSLVVQHLGARLPFEPITEVKKIMGL